MQTHDEVTDGLLLAATSRHLTLYLSVVQSNRCGLCWMAGQEQGWQTGCEQSCQGDRGARQVRPPAGGSLLG